MLAKWTMGDEPSSPRRIFNGRGRKQTSPTTWKWGRRRGRPWTEDEVIEAKFMRHLGLTGEQIGAVLGRSKQAVDAKINYQPYRKKYKLAA